MKPLWKTTVYYSTTKQKLQQPPDIIKIRPKNLNHLCSGKDMMEEETFFPRLLKDFSFLEITMFAQSEHFVGAIRRN